MKIEVQQIKDIESQAQILIDGLQNLMGDLRDASNESISPVDVNLSAISEMSDFLMKYKWTLENMDALQEE